MGCDDDLGWDVSVGEVELKQDWFGLVWVVGLDWAGLNRTDWFVKGGRWSQTGWSRAGQGRWMDMERESNKHFFVMQQKVDWLKGPGAMWL